MSLIHYTVSTKGCRWRPLHFPCRVCAQPFHLGDSVYARERHTQSDPTFKGDKRSYYHEECARKVNLL